MQFAWRLVRPYRHFGAPFLRPAGGAIAPPAPPATSPLNAKAKSGWGFAPDPTGGAISAPPDPLAVTGGGTPPPVPSPSCEYIYWTPPPPPLSQNPGSAPATLHKCSYITVQCAQMCTLYLKRISAPYTII